MEVTGFNEIMLQYGIFAALFVALLVYVMKTQEVREKKYQETISCLGQDIGNTTCDSNRVAKEVKAVVTSIDEKVVALGGEVREVRQGINEIKTSIAAR